MASKIDNNHNLSMFEINEKEKNINNSKKLDVVKMEYIGAEAIEWKDLFDGFDKLYAVPIF